MKYLKLIGIAALSLGFWACDDIEDSNSLPQTNPQLPGVDANNVKVVSGTGMSGVINLQTVNDADGSVNVAKVETPTDWPEGFEPSIPFMEYSATEDFAKPVQVKATMGAEGEALVNPDDWDAAFKELYGKRPAEKKGYVRFPVYAVNGSQSVRMGGEKVWYNTIPVDVIPLDTYGHVIEENYYVVGSFCNWDVTQGIKMSHSEYDPYDDPNFSVTLDVTGAGYEFVIVPESTVASGNVQTMAWGGEYPGAAVDLKGNNLLIATQGTEVNYMLIDEANPYQLKLDMGTLVFTTSVAYKQLYTPGDSNGWNQAASQTLTTTDYKNYSGFVHLKGGFKITTAPNWDGVNFGDGGEGKLSMDGSAGNINAPKDALYWVTVNLETLSYSLTEITTLGVIGDATPTEWGGQTNFEPSADFLTWTATVNMKNGEYKFRMNDNWDINLGGDLNDLTVGGANIPSPGEGEYVITLNLAARPYFCTVVKK
ncbi:MAG: hypothetical protein NC339_02055 [Muribaculaceae bacterium]|nr:hypothetical protein [Muribaculaceae bacterium]